MLRGVRLSLCHPEVAIPGAVDFTPFLQFLDVVLDGFWVGSSGFYCPMDHCTFRCHFIITLCLDVSDRLKGFFHTFHLGSFPSIRISIASIWFTTSAVGFDAFDLNVREYSRLADFGACCIFRPKAVIDGVPVPDQCIHGFSQQWPMQVYVESLGVGFVNDEDVSAIVRQ